MCVVQMYNMYMDKNGVGGCPQKTRRLIKQHVCRWTLENYNQNLFSDMKAGSLACMVGS
jgi:hypothetical protein